MNTRNQSISHACRKRLETQGYLNFSDSELSAHRFGIRFAYWVCITLASIGLIAGSTSIIISVAALAFVAAFPPYHPVDYVYNYTLRHLLKRPKLPYRTNQGRFACGVATIWLITTAFLFANNQTILGTALGFSLVAVGLLVSTTDICIPSMVYNFLFIRRKPKKT